MKKNLFLPRIPPLALILAAALCGCASTPPEQTSAPSGPGALTGIWKLTTADSSSQVLNFHDDGTGTWGAYDTQGQLTQSVEISYAFDEDTRFRRIGKEWVTFIPCEVREARLTLKTTGEVFTKQ